MPSNQKQVIFSSLGNLKKKKKKNTFKEQGEEQVKANKGKNTNDYS